MQAHIELDLIAKMKKQEKRNVLASIYNSPKHYNEVFTTLVVERSRKKDMGNKLVDSIKEAVKSTTTSIKQGKDNFGISFRKSHDDLLPPELLKKFPAGVWDEVEKQEDSHSLSKRDWIEIGTEIQKNVEQWKQEMAPALADEKLCGFVKDQLERERGRTATTRERCPVPCPHCKMLCINSAGHETYEQSNLGKLHDTHHQPKGLCGRHWTGTDELSETTCTESVINGDRFRRNGYWISYKVWCTVHPSWALPNIVDKKHKLLEYIFANYQDELVKKFTGTKCCPDSKLQSFYHDLDEIEMECREQAYGERKKLVSFVA